MTDSELLEFMGDDASKWASEFCRVARSREMDIDEGWMTTWFANAIEHSWTVRTRNAGRQDSPR